MSVNSFDRLFPNQDALAENQSAVDVMGDASLRVIAHELLTSLKGSITVDWAHRESARARMRVLVKRILRRYGYPPDLQDAAIQVVLQHPAALGQKFAVFLDTSHDVRLINFWKISPPGSHSPANLNSHSSPANFGRHRHLP